MDVSHLSLGELKGSSSFSVKDLLDLQESAAVLHGVCGGGPGVPGGTGGPGGASSPPELGEIVHSNPTGHQGQTLPPAVTSAYYDQDNPYTRWLQSNENMQYGGKIQG